MLEKNVIWNPEQLFGFWVYRGANKLWPQKSFNKINCHHQKTRLVTNVKPNLGHFGQQLKKKRPLGNYSVFSALNYSRVTLFFKGHSRRDVPSCGTPQIYRNIKQIKKTLFLYRSNYLDKSYERGRDKTGLESQGKYFFDAKRHPGKWLNIHRKFANNQVNSSLVIN